MPELDFKGKEFVDNHHLAVPHRPLLPHPEKSIGEPRLDGNLIIHGDNLHALKSPLPNVRRQGGLHFHRSAVQHRQRRLVLQRQRE